MERTSGEGSGGVVAEDKGLSAESVEVHDHIRPFAWAQKQRVQLNGVAQETAVRADLCGGPDCAQDEAKAGPRRKRKRWAG